LEQTTFLYIATEITTAADVLNKEHLSNYDIGCIYVATLFMHSSFIKRTNALILTLQKYFKLNSKNITNIAMIHK
jgi:fucose permease